MESSVIALERILSYNFNNKSLLEEALTHPSYSASASYERLEFVGDSAIGLAITNYFFLASPHLHQGHLSLLRAANVSTEKLARVAVTHGLYNYVRRDSPAMDDKVFKLTFTSPLFLKIFFFFFFFFLPCFNFMSVFFLLFRLKSLLILLP